MGQIRSTHNRWLSKIGLMFSFPAAIITFVKASRMYLDPGSGSIIIQVLVAGLLGLGFAIKASWGRIKSMFGKSENLNQDELE